MKPRLIVRCQLPKHFALATGLLAEGDVRINGGRLRAKVLVFATPKAMKDYWLHGLHKGNLGRGCLGAVNGLGHYTSKFTPLGEANRRIEADRRYVCVIGLVRGHLTMRIISHESVHAAYCFAKRKARSWWDAQARQFDEEAIAYPAGEIASGIVNLLIRTKMLEAGSTTEPKRSSRQRLKAAR